MKRTSAFRPWLDFGCAVGSPRQPPRPCLQCFCRFIDFVFVEQIAIHVFCLVSSLVRVGYIICEAWQLHANVWLRECSIVSKVHCKSSLRTRQVFWSICLQNPHVRANAGIKILEPKSGRQAVMNGDGSKQGRGVGAWSRSPVNSCRSICISNHNAN